MYMFINISIFSDETWHYAQLLLMEQRQWRRPVLCHTEYRKTSTQYATHRRWESGSAWGGIFQSGSSALSLYWRRHILLVLLTLAIVDTEVLLVAAPRVNIELEVVQIEQTGTLFSLLLRKNTAVMTYVRSLHTFVIMDSRTCSRWTGVWRENVDCRQLGT